MAEKKKEESRRGKDVKTTGNWTKLVSPVYDACAQAKVSHSHITAREIMQKRLEAAMGNLLIHIHELRVIRMSRDPRTRDRSPLESNSWTRGKWRMRKKVTAWLNVSRDTQTLQTRIERTSVRVVIAIISHEINVIAMCALLADVFIRIDMSTENLCAKTSPPWLIREMMETRVRDFFIRWTTRDERCN